MPSRPSPSTRSPTCSTICRGTCGRSTPRGARPRWRRSRASASRRRRSSATGSRRDAALTTTSWRRACRRGCWSCSTCRGWGRRRSSCSGTSGASRRLDELSKAIGDGALEGLKGIGEKKIQQIKEGIALRHAAGERRSLGTATKAANLILFAVARGRGRREGGVGRQRAAGAGDGRRSGTSSSRRRRAATRRRNLVKIFSEFPQFEKVLVRGDSKCSAVTSGRVAGRLPRRAAGEFWGGVRLLHRQHQDHNKKLRGLALDRGHTLNEWGIFAKDAVGGGGRRSPATRRRFRRKRGRRRRRFTSGSAWRGFRRRCGKTAAKLSWRWRTSCQR